MITEPHIPHPDDFYAALLEAHEGLSDRESASLNARLVLLLANRVVACGPPDKVLVEDLLGAAYGGRVLRLPSGLVVVDDPHHASHTHAPVVG